MTEKQNSTSRHDDAIDRANEGIGGISATTYSEQPSADPARRRISLREAMSDEEYADYLACSADDISDEDLFE